MENKNEEYKISEGEDDIEKIEENNYLSRKESTKEFDSYRIENESDDKINVDEELRKTLKYNIHENISKHDLVKITGDEEIKTNFNNNSYYLGN